jgi:hypothetical protein
LRVCSLGFRVMVSGIGSRVYVFRDQG